MGKAEPTCAEENVQTENGMSLWACFVVLSGHSTVMNINSTGEFQQLQVTMHSFSFPQINQKQTRERVCSDSLLFWPWMPVSSIYLELKQSVLVAQGQEMKTKLVSNVL